MTKPPAKEASHPCRIRLSRARGWRMPPNTVKVDRSTVWGNPYRDDDAVLPWGASSAADAFDRWLQLTAEGRDLRNRAVRELRGKQLACWCSLDASCHADVLIGAANVGDRAVYRRTHRRMQYEMLTADR